MPLINPRLIKTKLPLADIPAAHLSLLQKWQESIINRQIFSQKETALHGHFVQKILIEILGYQGFGGDIWSLAQEQKIGAGSVDVALGHFTAHSAKILAPFELKGAKTKDLDAIMPGRHKSPVQQAWEYAMDAPGAQWVLVSNYLEIRLYAVGQGRQAYEVWDLAKLTEPTEYARLQWLLSAKQLLSGASLKILEHSEQLEKEITAQLYRDYKSIRETLLRSLAADNPGLAPLDCIRHAQKILDRILFIAFAEDRGLLPERSIAQAYQHRNPYNPRPVWENFKGLFRAIDQGDSALNIPAYNGGLFAPDADLEILIISNALCEAFKNLAEYDFASEVSVTVLGHIFEQSISDIEGLRAQAGGEKDSEISRRKKDGIFYTPAYITRYIVEQAVGGWLADRKQAIGFDNLPALTESDYESIKIITRGKRKGTVEHSNTVKRHIQAWEAYKTALSHIKVLDPACGSGAFLTEVFDYLYREGQIVNNQLADLNAGQTQLFRWDTHILANNLYGVDINHESIEITKLSLWLKTANKQEKLTYLDDNIKCGNSLIDDSNLAGDKAFKWDVEFADIMQAGGFDVVVGNPPYGASLTCAEKQYIESTYECFKGNGDIYTAFIQKAFGLITENSYFGYITPVSWQTGYNYLRVREKLALDGILIIGIKLPYNTFREAYVDTGIYILKKGTCVKYHSKVYDFPVRYSINNSIELSLKFRYLDSTLWTQLESKKIIFNPSFYSLTAKLMNNCIKLGAISDSVRGILAKEEDISSEPKKDSKRYFTGNIYRYEFQPSFMYVIYGENLKEKPRDYKFFVGYRILIRRLINRQLRVMSMIVCDEFVNKKDLYSLIISSDFKLEYILAIINSKITSFILTTGSTASTKDDFSQITLSDIRNINIPHATQEEQSWISEKALFILENSKLLNDLLLMFANLIKSEFSLSKLTKKLLSWHDLSFSDFIAELEKLKVKIPLSKKAEWMGYFKVQKEKALTLKADIAKTDKEIDHMVYALYGLTADEISVVEASERRN